MKKIVSFYIFINAVINTFFQTYTGSIIHIIDGDTFVFKNKGGSFIV